MTARQAFNKTQRHDAKAAADTIRQVLIDANRQKLIERESKLHGPLENLNWVELQDARIDALIDHDDARLAEVDRAISTLRDRTEKGENP